MSDTRHSWWRSGVIYQVYPRSFRDANGDGVGDLRGITESVEYLRWLGVSAVWLSPVYPSPMADFGYDISDYRGIDPLFGSMSDFDELLAELHKAGIKLILDFVPNHTSDQHPWFLESRSSRDNPKRDWYLWHDPGASGNVPNNWRAMFGGPAWEWDEATGQYYYHAFLKEQPDLNWRNPEVRAAMYDIMRFWLAKGVDGLRVDVMWHLVKDARWRDNPVNPAWQPALSDYDALLPVYSTDQPEVHDIVREMRAVMDAWPDRMMIGEIYLPMERLVAYYGEKGDGAHMPYNFQLLMLPWEAPTLASAIDQYEALLPESGWPNWVLGNHDQPRIASRVGREQAPVAAMLLLTLRGTPTLYYGDEIGMRDVPIPPDEERDPQGLRMPGRNLSRDPARTPLPWDGGEGAGFTRGVPWLPLDRNHARVNVAAQRGDPESLLSLHRRLLALRAGSPALSLGTYRPVAAPAPLLAYLREAEEEDAGGRRERFLILLNLGHRPRTFNLPEMFPEGVVAVATGPWREGQKVSGTLELWGDEGLVIRAEDPSPAPGSIVREEP